MRRLVLLLAVFLINLPAVHHAWTDHQIARDGRDAEAVVLAARTINGRHLVDYRLPKDLDPAGTRFSAAVDDAAYELARSTQRLAVRAIPGRPGANRPDGEVFSQIFVVAAVGADVVLVLIAALWWWRRRWGEPAESGSAGDGPA